MNPCINLIHLIPEYQAHCDLTFRQAIEAMRRDLQDHYDLITGKTDEEPHGS